MRLKFLVVLGLAVSSAAHAGDKVLYQPAPGWVKPAPAIDATKLTDASPIFVNYDAQQRIQAGQVWAYSDVATRIASQQVLTEAGTIKLPWDPDKGDLIVHNAEIIRGTEHIDLIAGGQRFSVLRREEQLEELQINGQLTATMAVQGLRVGDVLHLVYSSTTTDAALKGNAQAGANLPALPQQLQYGHLRILWPEGTDLHWRSYAKGVTPVVTHAGGVQELNLSLPIPEQPEMPKDVPLRYHSLPELEASTFPDWQAISRVMAPLYRTEGTIAPGSPLAQEVATIAAATQDPRTRAAMALRLVQDKVRYLFNGMDGGNYVPQAPSQTWSLRYGDCKAKTLLLLALLHALGVEAEPVLADTRVGDFLPLRVAIPAAFNHVLVHATIAGETLWLDGTAGGTRLADLDDTPPFHYVLPVRDAGAGLLPIVMRRSVRPDAIADIELDESAGIHFPAPFRIAITFRGGIADVLKLGPSQVGQTRFDQLTNQLLAHFFKNGVELRAGVSIDDVAGTATLTTTGLTMPEWSKDDGRFKGALDRAIGEIGFDPDRSRPAWQDLPVAGGDPTHMLVRTRIRLPDEGKGFTLDGDQILPDRLAGIQLSRATTLGEGWLTVEDRVVSTGDEVPASAIAATRQALDVARAHLLRAVAPADYPEHWALVLDRKRPHRFDAILAIYAKLIAERPTVAEVYGGRAWFLETIYDRPAALLDVNEMITLLPNAVNYEWRSRLYAALGETDKAIADLVQARTLDPGSGDIVRSLAELQEQRGQTDAALTLLADRISAGGKEKPIDIGAEVDVLADAGRVPEALKTIDAALTTSPSNFELLNERCWLKGTNNIQLDTALKDCTKAIELSDAPAAALDSRAMVYFRMNRPDDALADLNAALDTNSELPASLFMRGVIRTRASDPKGAADLAAARMISPQIDSRYAKWGIKP